MNRHWKGERDMYQIGDRVVYGIHGVCRVEALEERIVDRKRVTYLALEPVSKDGSRFLIPTHNEAAMGKIRPMLTVEQWNALLQPDRIQDSEWIFDDNRRKQAYRELISGGDREAILKMICAIYRHKEAQIVAGRKVHQCDDSFLRDAERLPAGELAVIMETDIPAAIQYLRSKIKKDTL